MPSEQSKSFAGDRLSVAFSSVGPALDYLIDLSQRTILFWDVMRQRGNGYREHLAKTVPHVLRYKVELVIDGRTLERPVNYGLVRIVPPDGVTIDPMLRPFVIVDPRAGHGPGIGGFKADSEIGVALRAGTPAILSASCPTPCPVRPSRISPAPRRPSSKELSSCTPMPTVSPAWSATARRVGRS